jgi:hypothetical protein
VNIAFDIYFFDFHGPALLDLRSHFPIDFDDNFYNYRIYRNSYFAYLQHGDNVLSKLLLLPFVLPLWLSVT